MNTVKRLVLVIDDDETDREHVLRMIGQNYAICQAATANVGIEMHKRLRPSCVLLDYHLTDADGLEVLKELRELGAQVILMTGQGSERVATEAMKRGAVDYLPKASTTYDALTGAVDRAIRHASALDQLSRAEEELGELLRVVAGQVQPAIHSALEQCRSGNGAKTDGSGPFSEVEGSLTRIESYFGELVRYVKVSAATSWERVDLRETALVALEEARIPRTVKADLTDLPIVIGSPDGLVTLFRVLFKSAYERGGDDLTRIVAWSELGSGFWTVALEDDGGPPTDRELAAELPHLQDERGWSLAVARKIARQHGGTLSIDSTHRGGVEFAVTLPNREVSF